jgi:hypothetical protein
VVGHFVVAVLIYVVVAVVLMYRDSIFLCGAYVVEFLTEITRLIIVEQKI